MEMVVLVDEHGTPVGEHDKSSVHGAVTPRHLAFSCHILDADGRLLMTRRALSKTTWPGVWTNAFCGHPQPGEPMEDAVRRRAVFELGVDIDEVVCVMPDFGYTAVDASGIQENEYCPVFVARAASPIVPNADEVAETQWTTPADLSAAVRAAPWAFSPWLVAHLDELEPHLSQAGAYV
jgi:isopentenyl-diphosphate delta-isomerase